MEVNSFVCQISCILEMQSSKPATPQWPLLPKNEVYIVFASYLLLFISQCKDTTHFHRKRKIKIGTILQINGLWKEKLNKSKYPKQNENICKQKKILK